MNPTPPPSSSGASNNEGSSSANDSSSSDETTPPPGHSFTSPVPTPRGIRNGAGKPGKRYSSGSMSRSYQSSSGFLAPGSAPTAPLFPNHLSSRPPPRPRAGSNVSATVRGSVASPSPMLRPAASSEDDALAAAVELLSCSFHHTPVITPTVLSGSIPRGGLEQLGSPPPVTGRSFMAPLPEEMKREDDEEAVVDVDMDDAEEARWRERGRSEEEDDGVFGRMEE